MVNRNLIRNLEDDDIARTGDSWPPRKKGKIGCSSISSTNNKTTPRAEIVDGRIVEINDEWALIDVGFKSEGTVSVSTNGARTKIRPRSATRSKS